MTAYKPLTRPEKQEISSVLCADPAFYTRNRLKMPILCHTKELGFKCEKCDSSTHYITCLEGHVRARHETSAKFNSFKRTHALCFKTL